MGDSFGDKVNVGDDVVGDVVGETVGLKVGGVDGLKVGWVVHTC